MTNTQRANKERLERIELHLKTFKLGSVADKKLSKNKAKQLDIWLRDLRDKKVEIIFLSTESEILIENIKTMLEKIKY